MQSILNKLKTHGLIVLLGVVLICFYFLPVFQGKVLQQNDVIQASAMQHEVLAHKEKTGNFSLWTNNLFCGMPTFMMGVDYKNPVIGHLLVPIETFFKSPTCFAIYYFLGFYLLMIVMGCSPWLSFIGALMYTFASYNFVILEAGHNTKARCIGFMPFIIAGVMLLFQRKYWLGAMLVGLFLFFQIKSNHPQITYYMLLTLGFYFLYQLVQAFLQKEIKTFAIATTIFIGASSLAVMANFTQLWVVYEYTKDTMRGGSELATTAKSETKNIKGLDKDYAFQWSYGKMETVTLLIPNAYGGSTGGTLNESSNVYKALTEQGVPENNAIQYANQMPTYWGPKPFTSGPVYLGAIVCFLFILGIFLIKENWRWWIFGASALSILLAWGKNLMWFNSLFFDMVPMYNKFRTVEMALVILQITFPVFGLMALKKILNKEVDNEKVMNALKYSAIITGVLLLLFALMPSLFLSFHGDGDDNLKKQLMSNGEAFAQKILKALIDDREAMAKMDAWRSLVFVGICAGSIWAFIKGKLKSNFVLIIIGLAVFVDLWGVDKRYLNDEKFHDADEINNSYTETTADIQILQDKTLSYRVFNVSSDPFNDALTSYHHKNIGGYNPAKLARYQDIIDSCLHKNNTNVINMLNTKYYIGKAQNGQEVAQLNPAALGNAWFVDTVKFVNSAKEEIGALNNFNPSTTAIIDASRFKDYVSKNIFEHDSASKINLIRNDLDELEYTYTSSKPQLVVMSEVYYADEKGKGWQAYVDGKEAKHCRVNYILRGMEMPAGNHKIVFKFEPKPFLQGQKISYIGSILLLLLIIASIAMYIRDKQKESQLIIDAPKPSDKKKK
ncbi:MAG: hypothetical protein RJA07_1080 [Bacteroidota bacterium]|jgi:hypothetical protein